MVFVKPQEGISQQTDYDGGIISAVSESGVSRRYYPFGMSKIPYTGSFPGQLEVDPPFGEVSGSGFFLTSSQWEQITVNPVEADGNEYLYNKNTLINTLNYFPTESGVTAHRPGFIIGGDTTSTTSPIVTGKL